MTPSQTNLIRRLSLSIPTLRILKLPSGAHTQRRNRLSLPILTFCILKLIADGCYLANTDFHYLFPHFIYWNYWVRPPSLGITSFTIHSHILHLETGYRLTSNINVLTFSTHSHISHIETTLLFWQQGHSNDFHYLFPHFVYWNWLPTVATWLTRTFTIHSHILYIETSETALESVAIFAFTIHSHISHIETRVQCTLRKK